MRKIAIAVLMLVFTAAFASAGEEASYWSREILVGYDSDAYYCLTYEAVQQDSDTEYYERVFWCKYSNTGVSIEKKLVREVEHTLVKEENKWVSVEIVELPLNIMGRLIANGAKIAFPMNVTERSFYLDGDGIHYDNGLENAIVVSDNRIREDIKKYRIWPDFQEYSKDKFKLVGHYSSSNTIFFVIQYGGLGHEYVMGCHKSGKCRYNKPEKLSYQVIIPVPISNLPRLRELVIHKVKKGQSLTRIAIKYGVTLKEIMAWNKLKNPDHIFIGQRLKIYK